MLKWQLSSLINNPPKLCNVIHTTCCTIADQATLKVWNRLAELTIPLSGHVELTLSILPEEELFRRAIGRNKVAKSTTADVVWFADCDYFYGPGCLDSLVEQVTEDDTLYFPGSQLISETHKSGDKLIEQCAMADYYGIVKEDSSTFVLKGMKKAIGGLQIVTGNTARERGYLPDTKWTQPVDREQGFQDTKCDIAYRKSMHEKKIQIPNLYRLRHSITGLQVRSKVRGVRYD